MCVFVFVFLFVFCYTLFIWKKNCSWSFQDEMRESQDSLPNKMLLEIDDEFRYIF